MKNKIFKLLIVIILISFNLIVYNSKCFATNMQVSVDKTSCFAGDSFAISISGINGRIKIIYNDNLELDILDDQWVDGNLTVTGIAKKEGMGIITVIPVDVSTDSPEPEEVTGQMSINIKVDKKKEIEQEYINLSEYENNNEYKEDQGTISEFGITDLYLYGINENNERKEINFLPKFDINTYIYTCNVQDDIKRIELIYDANEYKEFVKIIGQEKELKYGENIIKIEMKDNENEKKYKIIINKNKSMIEETTQEEIDTEYELINKINNREEMIKTSSKTKMVCLIIITLLIVGIIIYIKILNTKKESI